MRVAIVNVTAMSGSTGKIAYGMYRRLKEDGHEVRLYYGRNDAVTGTEEICMVTSKASVYLHVLLARLTGLHGYYSAAATRRLIRELEQNPPDLVQLYNLHGYYLNICMLLEYLKAKNIPTVYSMLDEYPYLGRCCYSFDCDQFQTGCQHCRQKLREYPATFWFRQARKALLDKKKAYDGFAQLCFTAPQWVLERAESSYLLKGKRMFCVDEYVDTDRVFYPREDYHGLPKELLQAKRDGKKIVLTVAPYSNARKGGHFFIEMAERFLGEAGQKAEQVNGASSDVQHAADAANVGADAGILFVYVGMDDPKAVIPGNCYAAGFVKDQVLLAEYYSIADVFVCTSLADTMPNTILDALACGTPVIGFDNTGIPYTAQEPIGRFVPTGDVDALCEVVNAAERKTRELSDACRSYALSRYSPEVYYQSMQEVYREALRG